MKINVKDLKVGDVFKHEKSDYVFCVAEISKTPLYTLEFTKVYPIICDCFSPVTNKTLGYLKLDDETKEVDLLYRKNETKYVPIENMINNNDKNN